MSQTITQTITERTRKANRAFQSRINRILRRADLSQAEKLHRLRKAIGEDAAKLERRRRAGGGA